MGRCCSPRRGWTPAFLWGCTGMSDGREGSAVSAPLLKEQAPTDAELMARLAQGPLDALGLLYRRYGKMVESIVRRSLPSSASLEAEDVSHEVFLTLAQVS